MLNHSRTSSDVRRQECIPDPAQKATRSGMTSGKARGRLRPHDPRHSGRPSRSSFDQGPFTGVLHDIAATGCSNDGITFAVLELRVDAQRTHLALVTSNDFGEISFLELIRGSEISFDFVSSGIAVLSLAQQSIEVRKHLLDQLIYLHQMAVEQGMDVTSAVEQLTVFMEQVACW